MYQVIMLQSSDLRKMFRGKDFEASLAPESSSQPPGSSKLRPANQEEMRMLMVDTASYAEMKVIYSTCCMTQDPQPLLCRPLQ